MKKYTGTLNNHETKTIEKTKTIKKKEERKTIEKRNKQRKKAERGKLLLAGDLVSST